MLRALLLLMGLAVGSAGWCLPSELLTHGGFESGAGPQGAPVGWTIVEGDVRLVGAPVHTGSLALEASDPGTGASVSVESARFPCQPDALYIAAAWLRPEGPARPSLYLQFFNDAGQRTGVIARFAPAGPEWASVTLAATPPRGAATVSVLIFSGAAETGRFQADDVSLREWPLSELGTGGVLPNPGFEVTSPDGSPPPGWLDATGAVTVIAGRAHAGERCLQLAGPASVHSARCPAQPGQRWRASAHAATAPDASARLAIEFVDGFLNPLGGAAATGASPDGSELATEAIAPAGATGVQVRLSADVSEVRVDDVSLRRVPREGPEVLDIAGNRQLFLDDEIIDETALLERVWHRPVKEPQPVIVPDMPWEQSSFLGVLGNSILFDEQAGQYRLYYIIYQMIGMSERQHFAVAVSSDGIHWEKPSLGIADFEGSTANNLLFDYGSERHGKELFFYTNFIRDLHDPDPARRYKALGFVMTHDATTRGMMVAFSPDGLHWTEPPENPVLPNGDTNTVLGWDDRISKYVAYPRTDGPTSARDIGYTTSDDFIHWTPAQTVMEPVPGDPPHYEIYGMPVVKYQGLYLGFPWAFIADGLEPLDTQLAFSRDGIKWGRDPHAPMFIPRGRAGTFDDAYAITANPIQVGDELLFYYMACGFPHGYAFVKETKFEGTVGLGRLRLDGFVSLSCFAGSGGYLVTRPLRFTGSRMTVNCDCPRGWLRVELQREDGTPVPGYAEADCDLITADAVHKTVTWRGNADVSAMAGQAIRVRLVVGDGELYSFGFTNEAP